MNEELITKAKEFATHAHRNHFRNDEAKTPYIFHLEEVANLVRESGGNDIEIAAAWLHDTVEDTETTLADIEREFGPDITALVNELTDRDEWLSLSLLERKAKQAERVKNENSSVKRVKLADQTSNVRIVGVGKLDFDMDTKRVYLEGAKGIANVCKGVSPYLDELFEERYISSKKHLESISGSFS